jgi:hypothetical protein
MRSQNIQIGRIVEHYLHSQSFYTNLWAAIGALLILIIINNFFCLENALTIVKILQSLFQMSEINFFPNPNRMWD